MNHSTKLFLIGLISLIFVASESALAFTLVRSSSGQSATGWADSQITFNIDGSCNSYRTAVDQAINTAADVWGRVPSSALKVSLGDATSLPQPITAYVGNSATSYAPTGSPIVYCDSSFGTNSGANANNIPGFATGQSFSSDGKIQGCLLVLNVQSGATANITTLSSTMVNTILTHEIGHCLGLGHSVDPNALMYYATSASRGTYLAQDDIDGVTYLFPKQELVGSSFPGCSAAIASTSVSHRAKQSLFARVLNFVGGDVMLGLLILAIFQFRKLRRNRSL